MPKSSVDQQNSPQLGDSLEWQPDDAGLREGMRAIRLANPNGYFDTYSKPVFPDREDLIIDLPALDSVPINPAAKKLLNQTEAPLNLPDHDRFDDIVFNLIAFYSQLNPNAQDHTKKTSNRWVVAKILHLDVDLVTKAVGRLCEQNLLSVANTGSLKLLNMTNEGVKKYSQSRFKTMYCYNINLYVTNNNTFILHYNKFNLRTKILTEAFKKTYPDFSDDQVGELVMRVDKIDRKSVV